MRRDISAATVAALALGAVLVAGCARRSPRYGTAGTHMQRVGADTVGQWLSGTRALLGTHKTTEGNTVTVDSSGALTVNLGDTATVHGHVTGDEDTVTISDDVCKDPGVYVVHGGPNGPMFTAVSDACAPRRADLTGDTTKPTGTAAP